MTSAGGKHVRMLQHPVTTVQHICFALFLGRSNSYQTWPRLEDSDESSFSFVHGTPIIGARLAGLWKP